jgi:predicted dehydrogenase
MPETEVTAFCDIDKEKLKMCGKKYGVSQLFVKYEDMIKSADVNVVVIATPMWDHARQSIQALESGMDVLSEVPAAMAFKECYALVEAVKRSHKRYMMAENCCYFKEIMLLKELVAAGNFGELYYGEGEYIHESRFLWHKPDGTITWRGHAVYEINGNFYPTHSLGPLYQMFNERVVKVCCLGSGSHTVPGTKLEDSIVTLCKTESGKLIRLRLDTLSNRPLTLYWALQGTKGCYEAPRGLGDTHKVWFSDDSKKEEWRPLQNYEEKYLPETWRAPSEQALSAGHHGSDYFMVKDFVDSILQNRKTPIDVYDALNMTAPGIASGISIAKGGEPVKVPDFKE